MRHATAIVVMMTTVAVEVVVDGASINNRVKAAKETAIVARLCFFVIRLFPSLNLFLNLR
jgi:hypothetical protein